MRINLNQLSIEDQAIVVELLTVLQANAAALPTKLVEEIAAVAVAGKDPRWQSERIREIFKRFAPKH